MACLSSKQCYVLTSSLPTPLLPLSFTVTGTSFPSLTSSCSLAISAIASSHPGGRSNSGWSDVPVPLLLPDTSVLAHCSYTGDWLPELDFPLLGLPEVLVGANSLPGLLGLEGTVFPLLLGPGITVSDSMLLGLVTVTLTGLLTGLT